MKKLLKTLVCTLALSLGLAAYADTVGDIYEIRPCDSTGTTIYGTDLPTIDNPLGRGDTFYFRMRLIGRDSETEGGGAWKLSYPGGTSSYVEEPVQIGLYVTDSRSGTGTGAIRFAKLVNTPTPVLKDGTYFTDLIFSYTVKAGEFALPIRLAASASAPMTEDTSASGYYFEPLRRTAWTITNEDGATCNFQICSDDRIYSVTNPESDARQTDPTLANCGFYVKTITFDDNWQTTDTAWRTIHKNSTTPKNGIMPSLITLPSGAAVENSVQLYVWSENDEVIRVVGGTETTLPTDNAGGELYTYVGTVTLQGGATSANFTLQARGEEGASTYIVLSSTPYYTISSATGAPIVDYLRVPVTVGEALPPTLTVKSSATSVTADSNWTTAKASLTVEASQAYTASDVTITITPEALGATEDVAKYVRFSTQNTVAAIDSLPSTIDVTLSAGSTETTPVYVYFLRADSHTTSSTVGITFTPEVTDSTVDAYFTSKNAAKVLVTSTPIISVDSPFNAIARQDTDVEITVSDAYADMADRTTGYKIFVRYPGSTTGSSFTQLSGTYGVGQNDLLYKLEDGTVTTEKPQLRFPTAGENLTAYIYVVSPISGQNSGKTYAFTANIEAARTVTLTADKSSYTEGEVATFTIEMSAEYEGEQLYAFLKPNITDVDVDKFAALTGNFVVGMENPYGIPMTTPRTTADLQFLDGYATPGFSIGFSVVLSTNPNWAGDENDGTVVTLYNSTYAYLRIYNAEPSIEGLEMNNVPATEDGYTFPNNIPKGQTRTFKAIVDDAGQYDLTNTDKPFQTRWTVSRNGIVYASSDNPKIIEGNPNDDGKEFSFQFNQAGTWTIKAEVKDKDMSKWGATSYSVNVVVLDSPNVVITPSEETYSETARNGTIEVGLSYWDEQLVDPLEVEVTIAPRTVGMDNPGLLKIDSTGNDIVENSYNYDVDTGTTTLRVSLTSTATARLIISEMDGTLVSSSDGFTINAKVVSTTELPTSLTPADEYYKAATTQRVYIENAVPVCTFVPDATNTNAWEVAGGPATSYPITWSVRSDAAADFSTTTESWTTPGILVSIQGCNNATNIYVTRATSQTFVPDFGTLQGDRPVTITIKDKDGSSQSQTYHYTVTPSKFLTLIAGGPSGATSSSTDSTKYYNADGRGAGHVYAGSTIVAATNFRLQWNCSSATSWEAYAFGYKVGDIDNGTLSDGMDCAISSSGSIGSSTTGYYTYPDTTYDSFFYRWLPIQVDSQGSGNNSSSQSTSSMIAPETRQGISAASITLPTKMTEDKTGYVETKYEAVFSKEYRAKDNLGDINQDGIPDIYAIRTWKSGEALADASSDIASLASHWVEGDYLPTVYAQWGLGSNDYAPGTVDACKFTAFKKLRGFHEGLNDTQYAYKSEADFSRAEQLAYQAAFYKWKFEAAESRAWTSADGFENTSYQWTEADGYNLESSSDTVFAWSPEPDSRMDLTLTDTDSDDFPDGWEYFFWYQAKVWAPAAQYLQATDPEASDLINSTQIRMFGMPRDGQTYVFESFNTNNIIEGTEIPLEDVIEHFNPVAATSGTLDFDNDGLADLEELALGTNPCHWDTDGDHMSDAWEVLMGTNALKDNRKENADGDYMAFFSTKGLWRTMLENGSVLFADADSTFDSKLYLNEDGTVKEGGVFKNVLVVMPKYLEDGTTPYLYGRIADTNTGSRVWARQMVEKPAYGWRQEVEISSGMVFTKPEPAVTNELILIHSQVYEAFGFDPRTAWGGETGTYLSSRWADAEDESGKSTNTVAYADYDEYLLRRFRQDMTTIPDTQKISAKVDGEFLRFANWTTCPTVIMVTNVVAGTASTTQAQAYQTALNSVTSTDERKTLMSVHGADTNKSGVPDGWTLYVGGNPCQGEDGGTPEDGDELEFAEEFAGTDSCNAYQGCESIYANHPGKKSGWYNKFFPTDPANADTDGDGVSDSDEGKTWEADFPYEGKTYENRDFSFIYGTPEDDGSLCIRGGGMNPCAVDTDRDGLPDGWERQFAGLPFSAGSSTYAFVTNVSEKVKALEVITPKLAQLRADGLLSTQKLDTAVIYIAGGMDATWKGDSKANAQDDSLKRVRDLDFDHDGLANGQEYLVQQMRHFRYDDDITPLMGRVLKGETDETRSEDVIRTAASVAKNDLYVSMVYGRERLAALCEEASPGLYSEQGLAFQLTEDVWRTLGYLAPPPHAWDKSASYVMFPPTLGCDSENGAEDELRALRYVSTDPRKADTDEDGMDDYYELYHGLNPILGNIGTLDHDVIANAYVGRGKLLTACYNSWTWTQINPSQAFDSSDATIMKLLDPVLYPWMMGIPQADPDGDGLRNDEEKVLADLASPQNYHTDPTPAWFTDCYTDKSYSYTTLYYRRSLEMLGLPFWTITSGSNIDEAYYKATQPDSALEEGAKYITSFETNEGYDTDNDWKSDATELARTVRQSTDPLNFSDPTRRQALYLDGVNSYAKTYRTSTRKTGNIDFYKQFTVEVWVCPENVTASTDYTIIDRCAMYPVSTKDKEGNIRANFRIGVKDGKPYGLFDTSDAVESGSDDPKTSPRVTSSASLEAGKWTHLALTYTGSTLSLYVNGELAAYAETTLIPATGVNSTQQTAGNIMGMTTYSVYPSLFAIGARPVKEADLASPEMKEFFKGWVDEVRVWDGARSAAEIKSAYKTALTFDEAATNREEVYTHLMSATADSSRNDNIGLKALAPELVQHYNFSTLPSATQSDWVITEPVGFTANVLSQIDETGLANGVGKLGLFANDTNNQNAIYTSEYIATWIPNTVDHLPILDGSSPDTFVYSKYLSGYGVLASESGVTMHNLRNTANPYVGHEVSVIDRAMRLFKLDQLKEQLPDSAVVKDVVNRYQYTIRSGFTVSGDLLACGNAYAKACPTMWDDLGASSPWEDTVTDSDADGLPDWWEKLYSGDATTIGWTDLVDYNGKDIPAWQAYLRDLAKGMQPDGSVNEDYIQTADSDGDGLVDWWKELYGLKGDANADDDGDGLSNYVEYLLSEIFDLGETFDPTVACSVNPNVSDYFYRIGQMYVGEIFTDHDRISDVWEDNYETKYASRYTYDAEEDEDGDGWSNYAEFLAGTDPTQVSLRNIDGERIPEYPVPTIEGNFVYDGTQNVQGHALIVKSFSDASLQSIPDAIWTIGGATTNLITDSKYLGYNSGLSQSFRLPPGKINPGSIIIKAKDLGLQVWHTSVDYVKEYTVSVNPNNASWEEVIFDRVSASDEHLGNLVMCIQTASSSSAAASNAVETVVGSVNYTTGETTIDFNLIQDTITLLYDTTGRWGAEIYSSSGVLLYRHTTTYNLANSFFRIEWKASPLIESGRSTYYLGSADQRSEDSNSYGHVKEGKNTFIAFYDLDDNGEYSAGEPYGFVNNVNVGWNTVPLTINLTDTSPVFARIKAIAGTGDSVAIGTNDRTVNHGSEDDCPSASELGFEEGTPSGGNFERIRVVRTGIDSTAIFSDDMQKIVLDKMVSASAEKYITEADILKDTLDLDWQDLAKDIASSTKFQDTPVTSVWYRIVMGNEPLPNAEGMASNNVMPVLVSRRFDSNAGYKNGAKPIILTSGDVKTPQPTFKWRLTIDARNTYTAFKVWVYAEDGTTLVWESDYEPMPARVWDSKLQCHTYTWQPPLYADALLPDGSGIFENGKNYKWKVEVYNAKFHPEHNKTMERNPSEPATFFMNVLTNSVDYGQINLAIRYYGPDVVAQNGKIRVQAFTSADFTGTPVAEGYVYNMDDIASTNAITANARIIGLEQGSYYIRAFIDTKPAGQAKYDGQFAAWKSWGIVCNRDDKLAKIYVPRTVTISSRVGTSPTIPLYIDDCDTDHDFLPDAWEMQTKGNLTTLTTTTLDQVLPGGFAMQEGLTKRITASGTLPSGLSAIMQNALSSAYVAAFLTNARLSSPDTVAADLAAATAGLDTEESTVAITGINLDTANNKVVLNVATDLQTTSETSASRIYTFSTRELEIVLWKSTSLGEDAVWEEVPNSRTRITIGEGATMVEADLSGNQDLTGAFYKVTVEEAN